jgi:DNA-directed RNA polymerase specialized sigma24 family protein
MKKERDPTREEFEKLLLWLASNPNSPGDSYQRFLNRAIQIFRSRGCVDAESLADEVSNRIAVRIYTLIEKYPEPMRCWLGFIDNVFLEWLRDQRKFANAKEPPPPRPPEELEKEDNCLEKCLREFTPAERDLFTHYFGGERRNHIKDRRKLAEELGLTANALRIQAHRLRKRARECMEECLGQASETINE